MTIDNFIWYEKHRPKGLNAMSLDPSHKAAFESYIEAEEIPHLLFQGIQGSGKTTLAKILMDLVPCTKLELNASSKERGVDTVKGRIRTFASSQPRKGHIKILLLDEADGLTRDALDALKGTMEEYSKNCRFILTCNNVDKITKPIQSRCTMFKFERFPRSKVVGLCKRILKKEGVTYDNIDDIEELVHKYYPDTRSIINNLQLASVSGAFKLETLTSLKVDPAEVGRLMVQGKLFSIRTYLANTNDFMFLYRWLFDSFIADNGDNDQKSEMAVIIADYLSKDTKVPDREINFVACLIDVMSVLEISVKHDK